MTKPTLVMLQLEILDWKTKQQLPWSSKFYDS